VTTACLAACATSRSSAIPRSNTVAAVPKLRGEWVLSRTVDNRHVTNVPTSLDVYLIFGKRHEIRDFDGCGHFDGTLRHFADGVMKAVNVGITSNGCLSLSAPLAAAGHGIDIALYRSRPIHICATDRRLTIATDEDTTLTYLPRH
jgi:hypothetical protein